MGKGGSHKPSNYPYNVSTEDNNDIPTTISSGGDCLNGKAAATLKIGDCVFMSATDTWNKSGVVANYAGVVGIVVGGLQTAMEVIQDDALIGVMVAANVNEPVLVLVFGIAKVLADLAIGAVNTKVTAGAVTPGRVSTVGAASGNYLGGTMDVAAGAASVIRLAVGLVG